MAAKFKSLSHHRDVKCGECSKPLPGPGRDWGYRKKGGLKDYFFLCNSCKRKGGDGAAMK